MTAKGNTPYQAVEKLNWSSLEKQKGKLVKLYKFPLDIKVRLFRVEVSTDRTEWLITNNLSQDSAQEAHQESSLRWKIEQLHREEKQLTGIAKCQCRTNRSQRNHIAAAALVWNRLKQIAYECQTTVYQLKQGLLSDYLRTQLVQPTIKFT